MEKTKVKYRLQGHEKFPLREGWINKGLMEVDSDEMIFLSKEAPDEFGIGNNMVKSLRYWMRALGLFESDTARGSILSQEGRMILNHDPYLEDIFSLWVMHSYIAKNKDEATTWYLYFNHCDAEILSKDQIEHILSRELIKYVGNDDFSDKSLKNDIDVLLNMYSKDKGLIDPEEKNVSPFSQLGLIKKVENQYVKTSPDLRNISEWVVLYELSQLMEGKDSISIEQVSNGEFSLSAIYHLGSVTINSFLDKLDALGYIRVDRTAGLDMIYRLNEFSKESVIEDYFGRLDR
ncbi:DUF4007 family protein [Pseudobutyrivibrio ruminis]|nr:DUF4007 family protein [Pseudobutyrivibrio ruminis]